MVNRIGQQLGNYRLVNLLGQGGFAEVYLGEHIFLKTKAAIKVLHTQVAKDDMESFLTEARTIANLVHPNIVRVLEFGLEGSTPFLVMDYAPNGTLRQRYPKGSRLSLPDIVTSIKQIADALQYAHDEKLIHRDIKPENMLVGRRKEVLLSDFGIALIAQSSRYQSTQGMAGTVAYMAPEQIQGKPRAASDQYALGVVVYEWISGDRPFHGTLTEIAVQHAVALPLPLHEKVSDILPDVEQVVMMALAKDPKQRFQNVQAFAKALEQASQSERVTFVKPPSSVLSAPPPSTAPSPVISPSSPSTNSEQDKRVSRISPSKQQGVPPTLLPVRISSPKQQGASPPLSPVSPVNKPGKSPQRSSIPASVPSPKENNSSKSSPPVPLSLRGSTRPRARVVVSLMSVLLLLLFVSLSGILLLREQPTTSSPSVSKVIYFPRNATATAQAKAAAITIARAQVLYINSTDKVPVVVMNTQDPKQQYWDQNATCLFSNGNYQVTNATVGQYTPCMEKKLAFKNFAYQVQMTIVHGDAGGLIFRSDDPSTTFYRFALTSQGVYDLYICQPSDCNPFTTGEGKALSIGRLVTQPNTLVGQFITLTVIAIDNHFYLYINGKFVNKADDPDSTTTEGEIGVYAASQVSSTTEVAFSHVQVWAIA